MRAAVVAALSKMDGQLLGCAEKRFNHNDL
jgi:hypothetical protein